MAPPRHDRLFDAIASFQALHAAACRAIRGKRRKPGAAAFMAAREKELLRLERALCDGSWRPGRYVEIELFDPKHRIVSAAPFPDRVVHHSLCAVVDPIFEQGFIHDSYANRIGKGTHRAIARYEQFRDRFAHVLRCDVFRYFPAIDHAVLKTDLRRRIACDRTLWLLDTVIDGSNPQEPVNIHYPGDTLFTPWERRRGLPIGNLTSQFFANVYLDGLDHFCKEVLRAPYLRYMDDFALFADDPETLDVWRERIVGYLARRRLSLHPRKTMMAPTAHPAVFLGLVLLPGGRRRLPEDNVRRFRNRLRGMRDRYHAGSLDVEDAHRRIQSWSAYADHADTWRLRDAIFRSATFVAVRRPDRPPSASCAAVPGTTIRGTSAPRTATGTPPTPGTTQSGFVRPVHSAAGAGTVMAVSGVQECVQGRS